ncbi:MAG: EamA family transporter [Chloroflexi bacterium]|nr:EamA family transporter [Chloroflexota bacterium]MCL5110893.1 EamA family transporter [Chloroflexota bacterium]
MQGSGASVIKYATLYRRRQESRLAGFVLLMGLAFLLFGCGFPIYTYGVSLTKLSTAQPVFSATIFVTTTLASALFFRERLSLLRLAGMAAIIAGIVMVIS